MNSLQPGAHSRSNTFARFDNRSSRRKGYHFGGASCGCPHETSQQLRDHMAEQVKMRREAGDSWVELGLVFCTRQGSALDAANVRGSFRLVASAAGLNHTEWTPRELRRSLVSLLSSSGVTIEEIAHLVGHGSTSGTQRGPEGTAPSQHTWGARHQRALRWRRQAIGRQFFGRQVNRSRCQTRAQGRKRVAD